MNNDINTVKVRRIFGVILLFVAFTTTQAQEVVGTNAVRTIKAEEMPTQATVTFDVQQIKAMGESPSASGSTGSSQWELYANKPLSENVKVQLYPQLRKYIFNFGQRAATNVLLDWIQTSFKFSSRSKRQTSSKQINRPFFPEEMLYYLNGDSEDFAILFSRIIRDLLGLDVALVNYTSMVDGRPFSHMATAIAFTDEVTGDAVFVGEQRYVIADPTYQGAPVGRTHPHCDNSKAQIIVLKR